VTILLYLEMIPDHDLVITHSIHCIHQSPENRKTEKLEHIRHRMFAKCGGNERDGYHFTYLIELYFKMIVSNGYCVLAYRNKNRRYCCYRKVCDKVRGDCHTRSGGILRQVPLI
jgi:hypothetical protein